MSTTAATQMEAFGDYCAKDAAFKELSEKSLAKLASAKEITSKWANNSAETESPTLTDEARAAQIELTDYTEKANIRRAILRAEYDQKAEAIKGMVTGNPLTVNASGNTVLSLPQIIANNEVFKNLPDRFDEEGTVIGKMWTQLPKKEFSFEISRKEMSPMAALKAIRNPQEAIARMQDAMKSGEITTTVAPTFYQPIPTIVPYPLVATRIMDLVPTAQAIAKTVTYRKETSLTRNEATTAENTAPTNSTYEWTLETDTAYMIKGKFVISEEEIMDIPNMIEFATFEAVRDLRRTTAGKILQGPGGADFNGVYNQADASTAFVLGTTAPTTDNNGDAITIIDAINYSIKTLKVTGACMPDMAVCHPNQMTAIRETKDKFGRYLYGDPSQQVTPDLFIWGIRLIDEIEAIDGSMLVGDWGGFYTLYLNQGLTTELGYDSDNFGKWMRTLRFSLRGLNQVRRTTAFSVVSNLPS